MTFFYHLFQLQTNLIFSRLYFPSFQGDSYSFSLIFFFLVFFSKYLSFLIINSLLVLSLFIIFIYLEGPSSLNSYGIKKLKTGIIFSNQVKSFVSFFSFNFIFNSLLKSLNYIIINFILYIKLFVCAKKLPQNW